MDSILAEATFGDQDAGSGPVHASPNIGPMTATIHNISTRNLHDISTTLPDERQFLRSWRRQLQDCMNQQNARIIRFLLSDPSGAITAEEEMTRRCQEVLGKYSKSTWSFTSSTRDLSLSTTANSAMEEIEREIGIAPSVLHDIMRRVVRLYVNTATQLCTAESQLEDKLKRLEVIIGRINDLMFLEPTVQLGELQTPVRTYLDSVLEKISIKDNYCEVVEQYKKFAALKGLVSLGNFQQGHIPTCSICMTREISKAAVPCGHTFCEDCYRKQVATCYICRTQIRDHVRLFFA